MECLFHSKLVSQHKSGKIKQKTHKFSMKKSGRTISDPFSPFFSSRLIFSEVKHSTANKQKGEEQGEKKAKKKKNVNVAWLLTDQLLNCWKRITFLSHDVLSPLLERCDATRQHRQRERKCRTKPKTNKFLKVRLVILLYLQR